MARWSSRPVRLFWATPAGFVPAQDQGYALAAIQLPPGKLDRADRRRAQEGGEEAARRARHRGGGDVRRLRRRHRAPGVQRRPPPMSPSSHSTSAPAPAGPKRISRTTCAPRWPTWTRRSSSSSRRRVIQGIGNGGGLPDDRAGPHGGGLSGARTGGPGPDRRGAQADPSLANVFTLFNTATPRIYADIDRAKADMLGVPAGARVRGAAGLSRLGLCQRLQPARPHLSA